MGPSSPSGPESPFIPLIPYTLRRYSNGCTYHHMATVYTYNVSFFSFVSLWTSITFWTLERDKRKNYTHEHTNYRSLLELKITGCTNAWDAFAKLILKCIMGAIFTLVLSTHGQWSTATTSVMITQNTPKGFHFLGLNFSSHLYHAMYFCQLRQSLLTRSPFFPFGPISPESPFSPWMQDRHSLQ